MEIELETQASYWGKIWQSVSLLRDLYFSKAIGFEVVFQVLFCLIKYFMIYDVLCLLKVDQS